MPLSDVSLEDFMLPCFAYARRRVGMPDMSYTDFTKMEALPCPGNLLEIPVGAIVWWDVDEHCQDMQLTVKHDRIINTPVKVREHFGVYEGYGLVSDLCVPSDGGPYIRFREIKKLYKRPRSYVVVEGANVKN